MEWSNIKSVLPLEDEKCICRFVDHNGNEKIVIDSMGYDNFNVYGWGYKGLCTHYTHWIYFPDIGK
jgi:hypothetical protein